MRVLTVADGRSAEIYEGAFAKAFEALGHDVQAFTWKEFFKHYQYPTVYETDGNRLKSLYYRFQNKLIFGPAVWGLNRALLAKVRAFQPEMVFVYRGTHIFPNTLKKMRKMGVIVLGYNNDDPFSKRHGWALWRLFKRGIPYYHHLFAYRAHNMAEYCALGAEATSLLRSYYRPEKNRKTKGTKAFACDVIFIGHFEDDGRDLALLALCEAGLNVKLYGTGWEKSAKRGEIERQFGNIQPLYGHDYNTALNSARMALVFLSKLNRDTYTRRCFEIPATGTCMVCEYTDDLAENLFTPEVEAVYFRTVEELVEKAVYLRENPEVCAAIGAAGRARLLRDGHTALDRVRVVLEVCGEAKTVTA